ncbi:MAG TPA: hypothetical protein VF701_18990 [Thermoanaerobaculia bacterium]
MRRVILVAALALLAVPSFAALEYEFIQRNSSDDSAVPGTDLTARVVVDGARSRVDFLSGTLYPPGTYVVSTDDARRLYFVDPARQWYTEVNTAGVASALGASTIKIENLKSNLEKLGSGPMVAGIATDHYRLTLNYDISVTLRSLPLRQRVRTEIDSYTTTLYGSVQQLALAQAYRTGNAELDRLLEAENTKIPGFPLRQSVTIKTNYDRASRSKIEMPASRTISREMWVTKIGETEARASQFIVPVGFRRADQPELPKAATTLEFDPN